MKTSAVGIEPSKTSQTRWERHHNTFTPSLHLVPFCQLCFVFASCVRSRVVEGSWEGIAGCVAHVDVHGECICCEYNSSLTTFCRQFCKQHSRQYKHVFKPMMTKSHNISTILLSNSLVPRLLRSGTRN